MPRERAAEKGARAPHLRPGPWSVRSSGCPRARGPHLASGSSLLTTASGSSPATHADGRSSAHRDRPMGAQARSWTRGRRLGVSGKCVRIAPAPFLGGLERERAQVSAGARVYIDRKNSCRPVRSARLVRDSTRGLYGEVEQAVERRRSSRRLSECGRRSSVRWFAGGEQPTVPIPVEGDDLPSHGVGDESIRDHCRLRARGSGAPGARRHARSVPIGA